MKKLISALAVVTITLSGFSFDIIATGNENPQLNGGGPVQNAPKAPVLPPAPPVSAQSAIVIEQSTGRVLYEKNADERKYPASTTKILTALLAIEACDDLNQKIKVSADAAGVEGSSIYLKAGEEISMKDLLYGLMLRSGNDAAVAIGDFVAGDTQKFAEMMNRRALELDCPNTHFVNPNGLQSSEHYTTARDLAKISRAAMKNEVFQYIVSSKSWVAERGEGDYTHFFNKNKVIFQYNGGSGIKTGYTTASGRCLAASSERNGMKLICIVMQAPNWFNDTYALMDYVYSVYEVENLIKKNQIISSVRVRNGERETAKITSHEDISIPKIKGEENKASIIYKIDTKVPAPVKRSLSCGSVEIYWDDGFLSDVPLYFAEDVEKKSNIFKRLKEKLL